MARGAGFGSGDYSLAVRRIADKTARVTSAEPRLRVGVVLFEDFEPLDVFGPAEVYGVLGDHLELCLVGPHLEPGLEGLAQRVHQRLDDGRWVAILEFEGRLIQHFREYWSTQSI